MTGLVARITGQADEARRALLNPTGIAPYTVLLHNGSAYVSNWGGRRPTALDPAGIGRQRRLAGGEGGTRGFADEPGRKQI